MLKENEQFDDLQLDGLKIIQSKDGYKFSTDSVLLANFGNAKASDKYLDLCSGSGVVAILFSWKYKIKNTSIIFINQPLLAIYIKHKINANKLTIKVDINDAKKYDIANVLLSVGVIIKSLILSFTLS